VVHGIREGKIVWSRPEIVVMNDHFGQGEVDAAHVARSSWGDWTVCRRGFCMSV